MVARLRVRHLEERDGASGEDFALTDLLLDRDLDRRYQYALGAFMTKK